jgi:hypothetical protein
LGYFALDLVNERQARLLIGGIILSLVVMHFVRRRVSGHEAEHGSWFPPTIGVLAGFTTLVANAAGPLMAVYMLAMRLPKMDFVGTGAVFFLLLNFFKVPFMVHLGLIQRREFHSQSDPGSARNRWRVVWPEAGDANRSTCVRKHRAHAQRGCWTEAVVLKRTRRSLFWARLCMETCKKHPDSVQIRIDCGLAAGGILSRTWRE